MSKMSGFYRITVWIANFAYLQLLWLLFTIVGLGVFGVFPATVTVFYIARKWLMGQSDIPIFRTFWYVYKTEFFKVNLLGYILSIIGYVLYVDINYFTFNASVFYSVAKIISIVFAYLFIGTCIFFFPVYVHFNFKLLDYIKYSFLISLSAPWRTALLIIITVTVIYMFSKVPGLIVFYFVSLVSFVWMWGVYSIFLDKNNNNEYKK